MSNCNTVDKGCEASINLLPDDILDGIFTTYINNGFTLFRKCALVCKRWNRLIRRSKSIIVNCIKYELAVPPQIQNHVDYNLLKMLKQSKFFTPEGVAIDFNDNMRIPEDMPLPLVSSCTGFKICPSLLAATLRSSCCKLNFKGKPFLFADLGHDRIVFFNLSEFLPSTQIYRNLQWPMSFSNVSSIAVFDEHINCLGEKNYSKAEPLVVLGMYSVFTEIVAVTCPSQKPSHIRLILPSVAIQCPNSRIVAIKNSFCSSLR